MRLFLTLIFFILLLRLELFSQEACDVPNDYYSYPFAFPHIANVLDDSAFALNYTYPGFWSYAGQLNMYYTNSNGYSFLFGLGLPYLMAGSHKKNRIFR